MFIWYLHENEINQEIYPTLCMKKQPAAVKPIRIAVTFNCYWFAINSACDEIKSFDAMRN